MLQQQTAPPKRRRASGKRSRMGCRTCRMRRKKCDETPGACKNCTSTGRLCEYDMQRLPFSGKVPATADRGAIPSLRSLEVADNLQWAVTSDERRCFSHFQHRTIPGLLGFFDSSLWRRLVLNMALSEPAVYHAVVALSALHQDSEIYGMPLPGQDLQNTWHQFALEQCGRSFAILNRRCASRDPWLRQIMLVCCLLFVMTEWLRGRYDNAFKHLQCGLRLLEESRTQQKQDKAPLDFCLIGAFLNLEVQSLQFGVAGTVQIDYEAELWNSEFSSFQEARQAFHYVLDAIFRFVFQCEDLSEAAISQDYEYLHSKQMSLISKLSRFGSSFESFCSCRKLNSKEQQGVDIIRLVHRSMALATMVCFLKKNALLAEYNPEYKAQLSMVENIMNKFPERPSFTFDIGIIPTLYFAAILCRDLPVRCRAIEILQSWPHREGSFDSNWAAFCALERMKAECLIQSQPDVHSSAAVELSGRAKQRWSDIQYGNYTLHDAIRSNKCMRAMPCIQLTLHLRSSRVD